MTHQSIDERELKSLRSLAGKNAEAIAQTLVHQGEQIQELRTMIETMTTNYQTMQGLVNAMQQQIHISLQQKYGHASTTPEDNVPKTVGPTA